MRRFGALFVGLLGSACASSTVASEPVEASGGQGGGGGTGGFSPAGGAGGGDACGCAPGPHNEVIYTVSDDAEIWAFDPTTKGLSYVRSLLCTGAEEPFSMAVDQQGRAHVLSASTRLVFTFDLAEKQDCEVAPYEPKQASYDLFGMSFAGPPSTCPNIYTLSYSGDGPFKEGAGLGELGVIDATGVLTPLATVDYDGGELAGTGDGRLFAFAGNQPAKLIEYDRETGATLSTLPLTGFEKTNASAFAFFGGSIYFFTESSAGCDECLEQTCPAEFAACQADPACLAELDCAIAQGDVSDYCGGGLSPELQACLTSTCGSECQMPSSAKVSQVTRFDLASHAGGDPVLEVIVPELPIRVVGAGDSVCVPLTPR